MKAFDAGGGEPKSGEGEQVAPRDLFDFYQRWRDFRPTVERLAGRPDLSAPEKQAVHWLMNLADRVGRHDL